MKMKIKSRSDASVSQRLAVEAAIKSREEHNMKTKTKHTPGPYGLNRHIGLDGNISWWVDSRSFDHPKIADSITNEADARLITAAPDLLEAAKEAACLIDELWRRSVESGIVGPQSTGLLRLRAAIAKAEG